MITEKLYLNQSLLLEFEAQVVAVTGSSIVLDRSAFYGEAGGQMSDEGQIIYEGENLAVIDCQYDAKGDLQHVLGKGTLVPPIGARIRGQVGHQRRREMMSQHSGQHLISTLFAQMLGGETVSSRLGSSTSTIDLELDELSDEQLQEVMERANEIVMENRPMQLLYPRPEEIARMKMRRPPKVTSNIRIVEIEGIDQTPCGGTHCSATGEIGPIHAIGRERFKQGIRVIFLCGTRVLARLARLEADLQRLGLLLGSGCAGVEESVIKLQKVIKHQNHRLGLARASLLKQQTEKLWLAHPPQATGFTAILVQEPEHELDELRALAAALAQREDVVALVLGKDKKSGDWRFVLESGTATGFSAGAWIKEQVRPLGGRGGGRANHAEGTLPADWDPTSLQLQPD